MEIVSCDSNQCNHFLLTPHLRTQREASADTGQISLMLSRFSLFYLFWVTWPKPKSEHYILLAAGKEINNFQVQNIITAPFSGL